MSFRKSVLQPESRSGTEVRPRFEQLQVAKVFAQLGAGAVVVVGAAVVCAAVVVVGAVVICAAVVVSASVESKMLWHHV